MSRPVLPPLPPSDLTSIDDLLTVEQRAELQADLTRMANLRRRVEAESRNIVIGCGE